MILFINDNYWNRWWNFEKGDNGGTKIKISSNVEDGEFILEFGKNFPDIKGVDNDIELHGVVVEKRENTITIKNDLKYEKDKSNEKIIAIFNSREIMNADIYVSTNLKRRINLLRKIPYCDFVVDYGDFMTDLYIVSFDINKDEEITFYKSYKSNSDIPIQKMVFKYYKSSSKFTCEVSKNFKASIKNLISLSEL